MRGAVSGLAIFTLFHVALSLVGIFTGFIVMSGFFASKNLARWSTVFLSTTLATSVTGYFFPFHGILPSHIVGLISIIVLIIAIITRGRLDSAGGRRTYVITSMIAQYLNSFVLIAQLFQKVPALKALAPTQSEPPFGITQGLVLVVFIVLTIMSARKFHGDVVA
jgi:hypothetical protein